MLNQSENNASKWTENERQKIIAVLQKDVRFQQENSIHLQYENSGQESQYFANV